MNQKHREQYPDPSDLEARIRNYELAARMQLYAEDVLDLSGETEATKKVTDAHVVAEVLRNPPEIS